MNNFQKNEIIGRTKFEKVLQAGKIDNWEFSDDTYSTYDCKYWSGEKEYIVEIKVRNAEHTTYDTWILEEAKYTSLMGLCSGNTSALYVNFFNDGYWCIWNLNNISDPITKRKSCKKTTAINTGYTNKTVIELTIESATYFGKLENDVVTILQYGKEEERRND